MPSRFCEMAWQRNKFFRLAAHYKIKLINNGRFFIRFIETISSQPFSYDLNCLPACIGRATCSSDKCAYSIRGYLYFSKYFSFEVLAGIHIFQIDHITITAYFSWTRPRTAARAIATSVSITSSAVIPISVTNAIPISASAPACICSCSVITAR